MPTLPPPPWQTSFVDPDDPTSPATVRLRQVTRSSFVLESSLEYVGPTGVPALPASATVLRPADLGDPALTDLASVPRALRWFVGSYGVHTPAALLHDRLIGRTNDLRVSQVHADRFFRFMLKDLGVRWVRRWLMWTAVAFGTRWRTPSLRWSLVTWLVLWVAGIGTLAFGVATGNLVVALIALAATAAASVLWGRQYGAGLLAAVTAVWVLPPTILGGVGFGIYWLIEQAVSALPIPGAVKGREPTGYRHF